jgi:hypothetical protein
LGGTGTDITPPPVDVAVPIPVPVAGPPPVDVAEPTPVPVAIAITIRQIMVTLKESIRSQLFFYIECEYSRETKVQDEYTCY